MNEVMKLEIEKCLEVLKSGGIFLYPTDTIWGIGCDATNEKAVEKIFNLKDRHDSKTMIILLDVTGRLPQYINEIPAQAYELMELSEDPLTIVLPGAKNLANNLIAEDGTVAVRIVMDEFCKNLVGRFRKPIVSTSANSSGENSPADFSEVSMKIKSGVDYIVGLRQQEKVNKKPSTIIKVGLKGEIEFIRK
ncbi:MAG: L-threonylcarbamoyladenylate synthase [Bacteroidota bacterium]